MLICSLCICIYVNIFFQIPSVNWRKYFSLNCKTSRNCVTVSDSFQEMWLHHSLYKGLHTLLTIMVFSYMHRFHHFLFVQTPFWHCLSFLSGDILYTHISAKMSLWPRQTKSLPFCSLFANKRNWHILEIKDTIIQSKAFLVTISNNVDRYTVYLELPKLHCFNIIGGFRQTNICVSTKKEILELNLTIVQHVHLSICQDIFMMINIWFSYSTICVAYWSM